MLVEFDSIKRVQKAGVVAVVRGYSEENAYQVAKACIKGKVTAIELAFTSPNADTTINKLCKEYHDDPRVIIGAGTVLDAATARIAIITGAKFIVSPSFNKETAKLCNLYEVPYIPGCFSPTEVQTAMKYGADVIKVFPASVAGKKVIKEMHGPFPNINIMPTGGINLKNMREWFENGAFVVGVGGSLVGPGDKDDYRAVTENAKQFHKEYLDIINKKEVEL